MKQLIDLTKRQQSILEFIEKNIEAGTADIIGQISDAFDKSSRVTIIRDLNILVKRGLIKRTGKGRGTVYKSAVSPIVKFVDTEKYFEKEADERIIKKEKFDFGDIKQWNDVFSLKELNFLTSLTDKYKEHIHSYSDNQIKKELERITIEFSWKSSHIEGNTYTLLDTERLIKENIEAEGKTHNEAMMILNHKQALEYAWNHPKLFKKITIPKIEDIHSIIAKDLGIAKNLRKRPVGIIGTAYKPYDNIFQIKEAMSDLCELLNKIQNPFVRTLAGIAGISYIQTFEDGNKRVSRLIGNAVLISENLCPLSFRSVDEILYKKAIILFYEQHTISPFKKIFLEQYEFAVNNYFL